MVPVVLRIVVVALLAPILYQLCSLLIVPLVMVANLLLAREPLQTTPLFSLLQMVLGLGGSGWALLVLWNRMAEGSSEEDGSEAGSHSQSQRDS